MFADSSGKFQVNAQFRVKDRFNLSNGQHQNQLYMWHCFLMLLALVLSGKITNMLSLGFEVKSFAKQNT